MKLKLDRDFFKRLLSKDNRMRLIAAMGIIGIILIMLSEMIPQAEDKKAPAKEDQSVSGDDTELFRKQTEKELKALLEQINGVGECSVMVTVEGTTEYVYAENISRDTDNDTDRTSDRYENDIVFTEKDGEKQALVKKIIKPKINGVVVVCKGGGNIRISERVIKAVSTALDLSSGSICVEEKI